MLNSKQPTLTQRDIFLYVTGKRHASANFQLLDNT